MEQKADELEVFALRMAHDIRTPISVVSLSLNAVARYVGTDERVQRALARGQRSIGQTTKIVDALLTFARAGAHPQPGAHAVVADVAKEVTEIMRTRAEQVGATVALRAHTRAFVPCPEGALGSVLSNLVGNALTYVEGAQTRQVTVDIAEKLGEVKTVVSDSGPGLPPGMDSDSLFLPYVRGKDARGSGLGLGLATVKRIVDAHGGRVGVISSPDGCAFWFTLPVQNSDPSSGAGRPTKHQERHRTDG